MDKGLLEMKSEQKDLVTPVGQMHHLMEKGWTGWWAPYFLPYENKSYCGLYEK
jgi:hypothetical protein